MGSGAGLGYFGEERNFLPLLGFKPHIVQPIAYSLYGLFQKLNARIYECYVYWTVHHLDS